MQQRRSGRPSLLVWLVALVVVVLVAAGGLVGLRLADDGDGGSAGDPTSSPSEGDGDGGDEPGDGDGDETPPAVPSDVAGAAALDPVPERSPAGVPVARVEGSISPDPAEGDDDLPDLYADDCQLGVDESELKECEYGVPKAEAKATIAVVGDSKAAQWLPALEILAQRYRWSLEVYTKSACPASTTAVTNAGDVYRTCSEFNRQVRERLTTRPVDLVFTVSGRGSAIEGRNRSGSLKVSDERLAVGLQAMWRIWAAAGSKVLVVSDTPKPVDPVDDTEIFDVPQCAEDNLDDLLECTFDRDRGVDVGGFRTQERAVELVGARNLTRALRGGEIPRRTRPDISFVNVIPWVCPTDTCPVVIGNVLVYRNGSHLTKTYVETMTPLFEKVLGVMGREPAQRPLRRASAR